MAGSILRRAGGHRLRRGDRRSRGPGSHPPTGNEHRSDTGATMAADRRLHAAAAAGDIRTIRQLVADGAAIDAPDDDGRTPVMIAAVARQTAAVGALVEAGADVDIRDNRSDNVLLYAGAEGLLDIVTLANEAGADPALTNRFGGTALIPACERGHE